MPVGKIHATAIATTCLAYFLDSCVYGGLQLDSLRRPCGSAASDLIMWQVIFHANTVQIEVTCLVTASVRHWFFSYLGRPGRENKNMSREKRDAL